MSRNGLLFRVGRTISGETAVEFALVGMALMFLIFGMIETGRMLWTWQALQSAAVDTARCVAISSSKCPSGAAYAVTVATQRGVAGVTSGEVTVNSAATCGGQGNFTQVIIVHGYRAILPGYPFVPAGGLKATACYPNNQ